MANYGYITLDAPVTDEVLEKHLTAAVHEWFGDKLLVIKANFKDLGPTWMVIVPGSEARSEDEARRKWLPLGDPAGFPVCLDAERRTIAFRHGFSPFERWCQGVVEELLCEAFDKSIVFDATDRVKRPGAREYRRGRTYSEYLTREFKKPLTESDLEYIGRQREHVPDAFW